MRANFLIILAAAMIVFVSATAGVNALDSHEGAINSPDKNAINSPDNHGKKYVVDKVGEKDLESLREKGCEIIKQHKKVASVSCSDDVAAALNLKEDIKVYAVDIIADAQIGADSAWASGYAGTDRKVAVLDTGIDYTHPELSDSFAGGWNEIANNDNPFDDNGHGTHVAGIITANGVDSRAKGVAPDAKVLAFKVLDSTGSGYFSDVIAAMYDVVDGQDGVYGTNDDYNADVISMSLGTSAPYLYTGSNCDYAYPEMVTAVAYANSRGVAVVA
ncbi:MAG: S8 family serine peptidase, partial [Nanoarchaeota archaeon]|nr:S8 family serine peptidase [Nanoarchaeota archaeon]